MRKRALYCGLLILLLALALVTSAGADCYAYPDSMPIDFGFNNGGYGCAGHGPGCQQCATVGPNYGQVCTYDWWGYAVDCFTYGNRQEYQIP